MEEKTLYHGSNSIVEYPEIRVTRFNKNFYFGFYCTAFRSQAIRWATRFSGFGILNEYCFQQLDGMTVLRFPEMSEEWLDFIIACRSGTPHFFCESVIWQERFLPHSCSG